MWIPDFIGSAKPGDEDLLTEIQGIGSLPEPVLNRLKTQHIKFSLEQQVINWLQVGSNSFLQVKRINPMMDDKLVCHRVGLNLQKTFYHDG